MAAYYNENDKLAAQWLRNLIAAGHLPDGDVDDRSIVDVVPGDLAGYDHCHFFAGIGGWALALAHAGFPDRRPAWTGSCPCQPFSKIGRGLGAEDQRHLWPAFFRLIQECRPPIVFGEQVAASVVRGWLDAVFDDMEGEGYACGSATLPACSVGAPHIRSRLFFACELDISQRSRLEGLGRDGNDRDEPGWINPQSDRSASASSAVDWSKCDWLSCADGQSRPVEPGAFPLAHGIPERVGRLRAYGNAIVPQLASEFVRAIIAN